MLSATARWRAGRFEEAVALLDEASAEIERTGERTWYPPIRCIRGEIHMSVGEPAEAETCFFTALDTARRQQARLWELRAATGLARLWQSQGKQGEARKLLSPIYDRFTEGFDTPYLQKRKDASGGAVTDTRIVRRIRGYILIPVFIA
jgi:predicted ATPase